MARSKTNPRAPSAQSHREVVRAVFGEFPRDVLLPAKIGMDALDWLGAIFYAIEVLHEKDGGEDQIKHLVALGHYVSTNIAETVGCEYADMLAKVEAAEAAEGGGA